MRLVAIAPAVKAWAFALSVFLTACFHVDAVAPEGAELVLIAATDSLGPDGDSTVLTAVIRLESGDLVAYHAEVTFLATSGGLCGLKKSRADCGTTPESSVPSYTVLTDNGMVRANFFTGPQEGTVSITARSGAAVDTIQIVVKKPAAPAPE